MDDAAVGYSCASAPHQRRLHPLVNARRRRPALPATVQQGPSKLRENQDSNKAKGSSNCRGSSFVYVHDFAGPTAKVVPCLFCSQPAVTRDRFRCLRFGNGDPALAEPVSVLVCSVVYLIFHLEYNSGLLQTELRT